MSRSRGVLARLQRHREQDRVAQDPIEQVEPKPAQITGEGVAGVLELLGRLSPKKQIDVFEQRPAVETKLDDGTVITARTKKEYRRFTRPVEGEMLRWLEGLSAGDVFYDIGANCGSLTLAAGAMHGSDVKIVAVEPGYANFESMVRNLSRNGMLDFVVPLQVGLLDRTRLEPLNYRVGTAAGLSLHAVGQPVDHLGNEFAAAETQMVIAYTFDDLLALDGLPTPTHVKIDVDGVEGPLLEGATRTLASGSIRELVVEIVDHDRAGTRVAAIRSYLQQHGYDLAETFQHHPTDNESFVADHLFRRNPRLGSS